MITHLIMKNMNSTSVDFERIIKLLFFFYMNARTWKLKEKYLHTIFFLLHTIYVRICLLSRNRVLKTQLNTETFRIRRRRKWQNAPYIVLSLALVCASAFVITFFYKSVYFRIVFKKFPMFVYEWADWVTVCCLNFCVWHLIVW